MKNWDYGSQAAYYVTVCTANRIHYFGEIVATQSKTTPYEMHLSGIGKIVDEEWLKTFEMRPDMNLSMGAYNVMPNHFHAIITIGENKYNTRGGIHHKNTNTKNKFGPQSKNLASVIRGFKIGVTVNARQTNPDFAWQSRFYDHIIRNHRSYLRIRQYIINNPIKWGEEAKKKR